MMKKTLLLVLWTLLPMSMMAASIDTDENGLKWIVDGTDRYILISETETETIGGTVYRASDFIPDANFRKFIRTLLNTGSTTRIYKGTKSGYKSFSTVNGSQTFNTNANFTPGMTVTQDAGIQNFEGIGYFSELVTLVIKPQGINGTFDLDLTKNKKLQYLQATDTEMKELNASELTSLVWLDLAPSSNAASDKAKLEVLNINGCTNLRGSALKNGTTTVMSQTYRNNNNFYLRASDANGYCNIKKIYARDCRNLKTFYFGCTLLEELDLRGCSSLQMISADHGLLTSDKIYLQGCSALKSFIMKRQKFTDLKFLLEPSTKDGYSRTGADIKKLETIQVNGGSYWIGGDYNMYRKDADGKPILVTNAIPEIDFSYTDGGALRQLLIANNLLTSIETIPNSIRSEKLTRIEIDGNFIPTLDLNSFSALDRQNSSPQYVFVDAEVVKGSAPDGSKDWVAVHFDNNQTYYSTKFTGGLEIFKNRYHMEMYPKTTDAEKKNEYKPLRHETNAWMCTIPETQSIPAARSVFGSTMTCPEGNNTDRHVFLMSKAELGNTDLDLNGRAVSYQYNTRFNQGLNSDGTPDETEVKTVTQGDFFQTVFMQTHSYILNINPATKDNSGVDFYSGTLCLDYDALIPDGVTVYFITGVKNTDNVLYENGQKVTEQQFTTFPFGGDEAPENKILPANTPVYVKATSQAGLYAFKPITEYNLKGWAQQRGENIKNTINVLHGAESSDLRVKAEYVEALTTAQNRKASQTNLLKAYLGEKYTTYDEKADSTHKEFYNIDKKTQLGNITPRTKLTLSREARTGKIGFWPYGGTTLAAHRCYIDSDDFLAAGGLAQSNSAKGGASFYFDFVETTGIQVVEHSEPQAVAEDVWYTLQGVRLAGRPSQRGVYIHNGKKEQIQ